MSSTLAELQKTLEAVESLTSESTPKNTRRAYDDALRYFAGWHLARFSAPHSFPIHPDVILIFISDHFNAHMGGELRTTMPPEVFEQLRASKFTKLYAAPSPATLFLRLAALSKSHQLLAAKSAQPDLHPNPFHQPAVKSLMATIRRTSASRPKQLHPPAPLSREPLLQLISHIEETDDSIHAIRDKAILLFAFCSGGRRRSEIADAQLSGLTLLDSGNYSYTLGKTKTNQMGISGPDDVKPVAGIAAYALTAWLEASGLQAGQPGRLFRAITRNGKLKESIDPSSIQLMVIRRARKAELNNYFTSKSLRSGFVTEAGTQDIPILEAMMMTGHKTMKAFLAYYQSKPLIENRSARLL